MMGLLRSILPFLNRRSNRFGRFGNYATRRNGGMALGTLASLAAPFVIKKLMAKRHAREHMRQAPQPAL